MAHRNTQRYRFAWLVVVILALILVHVTNACLVASSSSSSSSYSTISYTVSSSSMKQQYGRPDNTDSSTGTGTGTGTGSGGGGDDPMPELSYPPNGDIPPPPPPPDFMYYNPLYDIITSGRQAEILIAVSQEYVLCPGTENDMTCLSVWLTENPITYPEKTPQPPDTTSIAVEPMPMPPVYGNGPNDPGYQNGSLPNETTDSNSSGPGQSEPGYPGTGPDGRPEPWEEYSEKPYPDDTPYPPLPPPPPPPCMGYWSETILKGGIQGLTFEPGYFYILNVSAQMAGTDSGEPHQSMFVITHYYFYYYYDDVWYTEPNYGQTEPGYSGEGNVEQVTSTERHLSKLRHRQMSGCAYDYPVMASGVVPPAGARRAPVPFHQMNHKPGPLAATSFMVRQNSNGGSDERPSEQPPVPPPATSEIPGKPGADTYSIEVPVEIKLISIVSKEVLIAMPVGDSPKPEEPQDTKVPIGQDWVGDEEQALPSPTMDLQDGSGGGLGGSDTTPSSGLSTGAIVGIAVGCVALSAIVVAGAVIIIRRRRNAEHEPVDTPVV
eukprot:CAMPEP_0184692172 /NCGR_PEP_ID=MMETSP0313-20130426/760_1 /TAXON_ID=2792 /ORGANISM="Porphyridium aerugineum, Strain SAG 1380-2" /LENGTH=547 /DNA_ID=CAMNT_0027149983 /DNA_START=136 /DNA_END=1779 /DNA_ORIENTATION=-